MSITWDDIADLLAFAAVFDQRKADELDIKAWLGVAQLERWSAAAAQRVILEHYSRGGDKPRIDPAAITDRIRQLRSRAAESFESPRIPDGLPNADYPAWLRTQLAAHVDRLVDQWAVTGDEPPRAIQAPPGQIGTLPELVAAAPERVRGDIATASRRLASRAAPRTAS